MKNVRLRVRHVKGHVFALPDASLPCGLAGMAVGTKNLALCDFFENRGPGETCSAHVGKVFALISEMVELKYDRIALAALHARMLR